MPRKIIYLINPISGTKGKSSLQELITLKTRQQGIDFAIHPTNAEGNYDFLIPLIESENITDIVICGGDGTVNTVGAALRGTRIRVGIIPMGSGNGLAFAARIPKDPSKALDLIFTGQASYIDAFTINGQFSCMLCGIGFDAKVAHEFAVQPKRGLQTYIRLSLANFLNSGFYTFDITPQLSKSSTQKPDFTPRLSKGGTQRPGFTQQQPPNGSTAPGPAPRDPNAKTATPDASANPTFRTEAFFISIANANQFGNNVTIAPRASLSDGLLDIVIVKKASKIRMLFAVIRQVWGGFSVQLAPVDVMKRDILYFQVPALTIGNPQQAPIHIDGEPKATSSLFDIRIIPAVFQLIQP